MSTKKTDLYADNSLTKTFIYIRTLQRWCYVYVILVYLPTVYLKTVSMIYLYINIYIYIYILFNFNNLLRYNLFSLSKDILQYHKSTTTFLSRLRWFNSRKNFLQCDKALKLIPLTIDLKIGNWMSLLKLRVLTFRHLWWYYFEKIGWEAIKCFRKIFVNYLSYS